MTKFQKEKLLGYTEKGFGFFLSSMIACAVYLFFNFIDIEIRLNFAIGVTAVMAIACIACGLGINYFLRKWED